MRRDGNEVERFASLSMQRRHESYVEAVVNDPQRGSRYVTVDDLAAPPAPALDAPAAGDVPAGGYDGQRGRRRRRSGRHRLHRRPGRAHRPVRVRHRGDPAAGLPGDDLGRAWPPGAIAYCERRGDAMFVGAVPRGLRPRGRQGLRRRRCAAARCTARCTGRGSRSSTRWTSPAPQPLVCGPAGRPRARHLRADRRRARRLEGAGRRRGPPGRRARRRVRHDRRRPHRPGQATAASTASARCRARASSSTPRGR